MQADPVAIDKAVRASVSRVLLADKNKKDGARPDVAISDRLVPIARKAALRFLSPFVKREMFRRALVAVKRVVHLAEAVGEGGKSALVRKCLDGAKDAKAKKAVAELQRIGEGVFADVFAIDRDRAAKLVMIGEGKWRGSTLAEFETEVAMSRAAAKAGVGPAVYDAFPCFADAEGRIAAIMVMRRVHGVVLSEWLRSNPTDARRQKMADRLEKAINKLHAASVFHHSMNPENVMVEKGDVPVIIDYGNAQQTPERVWSSRRGVDERHADFWILDRIKDVRDVRSIRDGDSEKREIKRVTENVLDDLIGAGIVTF